MESYRSQTLPVTLEPVEQDVPYRAFIKSNTIMEKAELLLFRISSEEPKGIFRKQCRDDRDKNRGFAYLDKIICKNTRRKFPTFKRKSGRIALQLAPSLLSFALGPGLLHFKDIHLSTSLVCFFSSQYLCPPSLHCGLHGSCWIFPMAKSICLLSWEAGQQTNMLPKLLLG